MGGVASHFSTHALWFSASCKVVSISLNWVKNSGGGLFILAWGIAAMTGSLLTPTVMGLRWLACGILFPSRLIPFLDVCSSPGPKD